MVHLLQTLLSVNWQLPSPEEEEEEGTGLKGAGFFFSPWKDTDSFMDGSVTDCLAFRNFKKKKKRKKITSPISLRAYVSVKAHNVSAADLQPGLKMCDHIDSSSCNASANGFCNPLDVTSSAGQVVLGTLNPPPIIS